MPLGLWGLMQPHVWLALIQLSSVFCNICVKVWDPKDFQALRDDVATMLSLLDWELLVVFFNIMTHLTLHVVEELDVCEPVNVRWMYAIEDVQNLCKE
jgi:hypothetical protein